MSVVRLFLTGLFFLLFSPAIAKEDQTLVIVADDWPPFSGPTLPEKGMSLHVISHVLREAGYTVESKVVPWARIMDGARRGEFDIIGSLFFDESLEEFLSYGDPFFFTDIQLVQRIDAGHVFTSVRALEPYKIAVGDGFLYENEFDKAAYLDKVTVTTALQAIQMVAFERAELTLDSIDVVNYAIQQLDPSLTSLVEFAPGVLTSQGIHMAVNSNHPEAETILADFNRTLHDMRQDGRLDALVSLHVKQKE